MKCVTAFDAVAMLLLPQFIGPQSFHRFRYFWNAVSLGWPAAATLVCQHLIYTKISQGITYRCLSAHHTEIQRFCFGRDRIR